jgi:hypothetical protein
MTGDLKVLGAVLLAAAFALGLAFQAPTSLFVDLGPNDGPYVSDFRSEFEIDGDDLIHWSQRQGRITLPFHAGPGPVSISFRYKRHTELPAEMRVFLGVEPIDRFMAGPGDFVVRTIEVDASAATRLDLTFSAVSSEPRPLGLAFDWLSVRAAPFRTPILPTFEALVAVLVFIGAIYVLPRFMGFSRRASAAIAGAGVLLLIFAASGNKLFPIHVATSLGWRFPLFSAAVVAFARFRGRRPSSAFSRPEARFALLAFFLGTTLRLAGLFHPEYFYPDVRTHSKFVSLIWTEGSEGFFDAFIENQERHLLGLELVGDSWVPMPYPPLLYFLVYPFSRLQLPVEDWMKLIPTFVIGIESLFCFALAVRLGAPARLGAVAAAFHATAPMVAFRLVRAFYPGVVGHFLDFLVGIYLAYSFEKLQKSRAALALLALATVALVSYSGSPLALGFFLPSFAAVLALRPKAREDRARALNVLVAAALAATIAFSVFYVQYVPVLLSATGEGGGTLVDSRFTPFAAVQTAFDRLMRWYGPIFTALFGLGLFASRKFFPERPSGELATAVVATFLGLNLVRAGLGDTTAFESTKDEMLLLPLAALVLAGLAERGLSGSRWKRALAAALVTGWVLWGTLFFASHVRSRFQRTAFPETTPISLVSQRSQSANAMEFTMARASVRSNPSAIRADTCQLATPSRIQYRGP